MNSFISRLPWIHMLSVRWTDWSGLQLLCFGKLLNTWRIIIPAAAGSKQKQCYIIIQESLIMRKAISFAACNGSVCDIWNPPAMMKSAPHSHRPHYFSSGPLGSPRIVKAVVLKGPPSTQKLVRYRYVRSTNNFVDKKSVAIQVESDPVSYERGSLLLFKVQLLPRSSPETMIMISVDSYRRWRFEGYGHHLNKKPALLNHRVELLRMGPSWPPQLELHRWLQM
jgi:hypothetical protein